MKYAVITGSESGLAKKVIDLLIKNEFVVFAGDFKYQEISESKYLYKFPLDLTKNSQIEAFYHYVCKHTDHLDLVSNFAGTVRLGSFVEEDLDMLSKVMDLNLISTYKVNNIFFSLILKGQGRIINISSEYGKIDAIPFHGFYPVTKHAVEAYNDSLRRELLKLKIPVIEVRPGAFSTNMQAGVDSEFNRCYDKSVHFKHTLGTMKTLMIDELKKTHNPEIFAKKYLKIVLAKHPRRYYNIKNSFKMKLFSICPVGLQDFIFKHFF